MFFKWMQIMQITYKYYKKMCNILELVIHQQYLVSNSNPNSYPAISIESSTANCYISDLELIPMSVCWEVMIVRLPDNVPFWKCSLGLLIGQQSHQSKSSSS